MNRRAFLTTGLAGGAVAATTSAIAGEPSTEGNKIVARRFTLELWGAHNADVADELLAPNFVNHDPFPGTEGTREGEKRAVAIHSAAIADSEATVDDQVAEGDKVATRWTFYATHKGEFLGIPATGKRIKVTGMNISRFTDGKIAELWREVDVMALLQQLGAGPPLGKK